MCCFPAAVETYLLDSKSGNATFTVPNEWRLHHILSVSSFTVALNTSPASPIEHKVLVSFIQSCHVAHSVPASFIKLVLGVQFLLPSNFVWQLKLDLKQQRFNGEEAKRGRGGVGVF